MKVQDFLLKEYMEILGKISYSPLAKFQQVGVKKKKGLLASKMKELKAKSIELILMQHYAFSFRKHYCTK